MTVLGLYPSAGQARTRIRYAGTAKLEVVPATIDGVLGHAVVTEDDHGLEYSWDSNAEPGHRLQMVAPPC